MQDDVRVELVPLMVPADANVLAKRRDTVQRLAALGQIDPAQGVIPDTVQQGWLARVNGVGVLVDAFAVEPGEAGDRRVMVSLAVAADVVQVGDPALTGVQHSVRPSTPEATPAKVRAPWGAPGYPDPREGVPGWAPETTEPVKVEFTAGIGDRLVAEIRETVRRTYPGGPTEAFA